MICKGDALNILSTLYIFIVKCKNVFGETPMDVSIIEAAVTIGTTICGIAITYFITNKKVIKFIGIGSKIMRIVGDAYDTGKTDAEIGRQIRELCDEIDGDEATPELQYKE